MTDNLYPKVLFAVLLVIQLLDSTTSLGQAVTPVEDKNKRYQTERIVYERWNLFRPVWYYWLFHNKYDNEDRRNIFQYAPTLFATAVNLDQIEMEKEKVDSLSHFYLMQEANILAEKHYHLHFKSEFDQLKSTIAELLIQCQMESVNQNTISTFQNEQVMLEEYLTVIRNGHTDPGESQDAMTQIQEELETLERTIRKTIQLYKLRNRIEKIEMVK